VGEGYTLSTGVDGIEGRLLGDTDWSDGGPDCPAPQSRSGQ
jgi:hypothetical protein